MVADFVRRLTPPSIGARPAAGRAGVAIAALLAAVALAIATATQETTGSAVFTALLVPVLIAAWFGGPRVAIGFVAAIGVVMAYAVVPPRWAFTADAADTTRLIFLALTSGALIFLVERLRRETARSAELVGELARSNDAKTEFVQHVAHELRAPMTIIKGNSSILDVRWPSLGADERGAALADIVDSVERLEGIIENLLALARLEAGQVADREPVIVVKVVTAVVERHRKSNPARPYAIVESASRRAVICSPVYLAQVVENLLSNAEKYSPPGEEITIRIHRTPKVVTVAVLDRGKGVSAEQATRLFDPFYRADDAGGVTGLGIGLSVCRRFAEAEGGTMSVRPRDGGGAEFILTLPCSPEEMLAPAVDATLPTAVLDQAPAPSHT